MNTINLFPAAAVEVAPEVKAAKMVLTLGQQSAQALLNAYTVSYDAVWNNPAATPDKVVAALGVSAKAVFEHSVALAMFLASLGASVPTEAPKEWKVTFAADGSATAVKA